MLVATVGSNTSLGAFITLGVTTDATISDANGDGIFDTVNPNDLVNSIRQFPGIVIDRSVVEFSLAALPTNAVITSVSFQFTQQSFTSNSNLVSILGFAGNGSITVGDATRPAMQLGTYNPVAIGLSTAAVNLGANGVSLLQSLIGTSSLLGLRFQGDNGFVNTQFYSREGGITPGQPAPALLVNFETISAVPEPASLAMMGVGMAGVGSIGVRRLRRATRD